MAQHTPGPWEVITRYKTGINKGNKHIALVNFWNDKDEETRIGEEEHQANVALIAAAPELLASLEDLIDFYGGLIEERAGPADVNKAKQIINKAKGKQS